MLIIVPCRRLREAAGPPLNMLTELHMSASFVLSSTAKDPAIARLRVLHLNGWANRFAFLTSLSCRAAVYRTQLLIVKEQ